MNGSKFWNRILCGVFALVCYSQCFFVHEAFARSSAEIEAMIEDVLAERHPTDQPNWWRALGANAPQIIIGMYENSSHTYQRLRLLQGLGAFDTPEAGQFLKRQAEEATDDVIRNTSIRSVGNSQGAKETEFIAKFLKNTDPQTRYAAAETLRRLNDARANEVLEQYLKTEKLPWISQKLNGILPRPTGTLTPVASSEDRISSEFPGEWRGYWITPRGATEKGMKAEQVYLQIKSDGPNELKAELHVKKNKNQTRKWRIDRILGKTTHLTGVLIEEKTPEPSPSPSVSASVKTVIREEFPAELDLSQQSGNRIIEIHVKKVGMFLILRKDPV